MILALNLPQVGVQMRQGTVHKVLAKAGDALKPGTPLLEVKVDLGAAKAQDCPPIFFFRLMATERAALRSMEASVGDVLEVGARIGIASTDAAESTEVLPGRALRTTSVAIQTDPLSRR